MYKPSDFFSSKNIITNSSSIDLNQTNSYIEPIKAISRSGYSSIYVIDYKKQGFDYVSSNPLFLCGNTADEVLEMGYEFYFRHVPEEDIEFLLMMNEVCLDFYHDLPLDERKKYTLSYDFHLLSEAGLKILINQKITALFLTEDGRVWKSLCFVTLSPAKKAGNIKIFKEGENIVFKYNIIEKKWTSYPRITLSDREKEILTLSARGYNIDKISESIFISADTVKYHRRKLFEKLEVTNISEAIFFAVNNKLI